MKQLLLLLPLLLAAPVSAQVDPEIHKLCSNAKDYAGCVQTQMSVQSLYQQEVYVLLYKAGSAQEGIHSIDYDDGRVVIVAFEDKKDAVAFADKLTAQNFPTPTVSAFNGEDLEAFAIQAGYKLRFVRTGEQIDPPTSNLPTQHH